MKSDLRDSKLQTTSVALEARGTESWGGEEEKEGVAVEGADRAKGNRSSTYPHLHIFLSRVWRKRIGEYVSMSPEHNHTAQKAYGRSPSYSEGAAGAGGAHLTAHALMEGTRGSTVKGGMRQGGGF